MSDFEQGIGEHIEALREWTCRLPWKPKIGGGRIEIMVIDDMPDDTLVVASSRENAVIGTNIGKVK